MNATADRLVDDYLRRLRAELSDLPRAQRRELEQEVAEHIAEARADLDAENEAEIRTLLERLGEPEEIAAEARERFGVRPRRPGWMEVGALVLLPIGGVIVPVLGWFVGLALLWISEVWSTRDKLIGTFVLPGGFALPLFLTFFAVNTGESCMAGLDERGRVISETCTGGPSDAAQVLGAVVFVALLVAPLAAVVYLGWRARRPASV